MKTITYTWAVLFLLAASQLPAQIEFNPAGTSTNASAIFELTSTDKGMLVPRMTSAQRTAIASPATGLLVFDTDTGSFFFFNGAAWVNLSTPKVLADADGDTKIQVEESADEDIIRFDLAGSERLLLNRNANGNTLMDLPSNNSNIFLGTNAGTANTGARNTFIGAFSGVSNTAANDNCFFGYASGNDNTLGARNNFFGSSTGNANTSGSDNSFFGHNAGELNTVGFQNTFFGSFSGNSNTTAGSNSFFGYNSGFLNTTGGRNSFYGASAGVANSTGGDNSFFGFNSGNDNTTGFDNAFFGSGAGAFNTTAFSNSFFGSSSGALNTTGSSNSFFGFDAGETNTTGSSNCFFGVETGTLNTTGIRNAFFGNAAGNINSTGNDNTGFGWTALAANTTGTGNTALGFNADVLAGNLTNATAIGANAEVGASDCLVLGSLNGVNGATTTVKVGIGITVPTQRLQVGGNVYASGGDFYAADGAGVFNAGGGIMSATINIIADNAPTPLNADGDEDLYIDDVLELGGQGFKPGGGSWAAASDFRLKKDIQPYRDGLAKVLQINPVRYRYNEVFPIPDGDKEYVGVIAQDMAAIAPYMVELRPFGQKVEEDEQGKEIIVKPGVPYYTYDSSALTYMLVNAVKEQQAIIEELKKQVEGMKVEMETMKR